MKTILTLVATFLIVCHAGFAKEENGMRVEVTKSTISNDDPDRRGYFEEVDRTLGLKVQAKNISMKPFDVGELEWIIIIERWGSSTQRLERYKGTQKFDPLKPGESINLTVGKSSIEGYKGWGKRYQDKIEAWRVIIRHVGVDTITVVSGSAFERANSKAKDASKD